MKTVEKITWKYVKPLKDKELVSDFLKKHKVTLPTDMIQCVVENNGGRPSKYVFSTNERDEYVFQSLFSYNPGDKCTIYDVYPSLFGKTTLYPIGLESSGNIVCYDRKVKTYVLWNHENNKCEIILLNN